MKTWQWLTVVALALGVGVAVGYLARPDAEPGLPNTAVAPDAPQDALPAVQRAAPSPDDPPVRSSAPAGDPLMDLLRQLDTDQPPKGDGVITGTVLDDAGRPVPGVMIQLVPVETARRFISPTGVNVPLDQTLESLAEDIRRFARWRLSYRPAALAAKTGADGAFSIAALADVGYYLQAHHAAMKLSHSKWAEYRPGAHVEIGAVAWRVVKARVAVPPGVDPAKVAILAPANGEGAAFGGATRRADGLWDLKFVPGMYFVKAQCADPRGESEPVMVTVGPNTPETIDLALIVKPQIRGTVKIVGGTPEWSPRVWAVPAGPGEDPAGVLAARHSREEMSLYREVSDNAFNMEGPAGLYAVGLFDRDRLRAAKLVDHASAVTHVEFELSAPDAATAITVVCRGEGGEPQNVGLLSLSGYRGCVEDYAIWWRVGPGEYRLAAPVERPPGDDDRGTFTPVLTIYESRPFYTTVTLAHVGPQRVEVILPRTADVIFKLSGWTPPPQFALDYRLYDTTGRHIGPEGFEAAPGSDSGKAFIIRGTPLGKLRLEVHTYNQFLPFALWSGEIDVRPGGIVVDVVLRAPVTLVLTASDSNKAFAQLVAGEVAGAVFMVGDTLPLSNVPARDYELVWWFKDPEGGSTPKRRQAVRLTDNQAIDISR